MFFSKFALENILLPIQINLISKKLVGQDTHIHESVPNHSSSYGPAWCWF